MLATKQLNNGRFQVFATDYNYDKFSTSVALQILWKTFSTQLEAEAFIRQIK